VLIPDTVCGSRVNGGRREVLIAWKGMLVTEATWESFDEMRQQFPDFHLEDKPCLLNCKKLSSSESATELKFLSSSLHNYSPGPYREKSEVFTAIVTKYKRSGSKIYDQILC
nr:chromo domain containing protein [Tanacetum cinerariifolium]